MLSHFDFRALLDSDLSSQRTYVKQLSSSSMTLELMAQACICFKPRHCNASSPAVILSCGIHGNETAPIELLNILINDLLVTQNLSVPLLIIFANPEAIKKQVRFVDQNLNRLFDARGSGGGDSVRPFCHGKKQDNEVQRSIVIKQVVDDFVSKLAVTPSLLLHLDLHTAIRGSHHRKFAILPYQMNKPYEIVLQQLLAQAEVTHLVCHNQATATFSYYTSACYGASSATLELGRVNTFGCNDLNSLAEFKTCLMLLLSGHIDGFKRNLTPINLYYVKQQIVRENKCFKFNFSADLYNFTCFNKGDLLAIDGDKKIQVLGDEEYILFPNANVVIGERALLTLVKLKAKN